MIDQMNRWILVAAIKNCEIAGTMIRVILDSCSWSDNPKGMRPKLMILLEDDLQACILPIEQVSFKSCLPSKKMHLL